MEDYDEFEFQQIEQRKANESVLDQFTIWLKSTGISDATVRTHVSNIDFYINEYLLHEEVNEPAFGIETGKKAGHPNLFSPDALPFRSSITFKSKRPDILNFC